METISRKDADRLAIRDRLKSFVRRVIPGGWWERENGEKRSSRYARLWRFTVLITAGVSVTPLIIITIYDYYQYREAFRQEMMYPILRLTSTMKHSMEFFLEERRSALAYIIEDKSFDELADQEILARILRNMKNTFGGFVDVGLIDSTGKQRTYVGPYELQGMNYQEQDWFNEVKLRGAYVSDVFMGYRKFPHFVVAVKHERQNGDFYVLRATIDTKVFNHQIYSLGLRPASDAFIINDKGIFQTASRFHGNVLTPAPIPVPPYSNRPEVVEEYDGSGNPYVLGYAYIDQSPFIFVVVKGPEDLMENWLGLRRRMFGFLAISVGIILLLIMGTSSYLVSRIRDADLRQAKALHHIQYSNKMASIGRLAAGVAHEVNNPLAIINEKAGLAKDLIALSNGFPQREKFEKLMDSILASVTRCSTITHRLLGFAKRMDVKTEKIDLEALIQEVLGFVEKEAGYRNIAVSVRSDNTLPSIESDRGQLQQVFLNIINNAIEELEGGGQIDILLREQDQETVEITISDNGRGIPEEHLHHIFEPFFTTKKDYGTGLGLSITYGIMEKLGGGISVRSKVGQGTSFIVALPIRKPPL
ncbi:MAG: sensor histidine kinase [Candidatus Abyssobacteria bacterium SURF_5]|uniref:histidine kinase n=1 Tax=Abyssobacteria bacterium (strain SURF_5) TaxID=2093360 RepID=A0A3A4NK07_ABYX5|nr:MAG: sensor histidine kinase [Candidatus Abyssubacteria bacterium SURF_5]